MKFRFLHTHSLTLCILWFVVIFILCATPGQYLPSAGWMELLSLDKFVHAGIFFVLVSLANVSCIKFKTAPIAYVLVCLGSVMYGISLEWMQAHFFSNRSADYLDIVANTVGCLLSLLFVGKFKNWHIRLTHQKL